MSDETKMNSGKVLVGVIFSTRHIYVIEEFMQGLMAQDHSKFDVILLDTSSDNGSIKNWLDRHYPEVTYKHAHKDLGEHPFKKMCECRNYIFKWANDLDYDYVFFADCDTIIGPHTISKLIEDGKDVCGAYQSHGHLDITFPCVSKEGSFKLGVPGFAQQWDFYTWDELEGKSGLLQCFSTTMGATLISKKVFSGLKFEYTGTFGEDMLFWLRAKVAGVEVFTDLDLWVEHKNTGWDGLIYNTPLLEMNEV